MKRADVVVAISEFVADDLDRPHGDQLRSEGAGHSERGVVRSAVAGRAAGRRADRSRDRPVRVGWLPAQESRHARARVRRGRGAATRRAARGRRPGARADARGASRRPASAAWSASSALTDRVTVLGYVTDAELGALYRAASVLAMPSLFEGFGLPVVEALGLGVPVVSTRCGVAGRGVARARALRRRPDECCRDGRRAGRRAGRWHTPFRGGRRTGAGPL